jgi:S1-C subfamily serine protease
MRFGRGDKVRLLALVATAIAGVATLATFAPGRGSASIGTGVVTITTQLGYQDGAAAGTGIVMTSSGRVLTNNHVIANATSVTVSVPGTGHSYRGRVTGYDLGGDVAVVQLQGASNLTTASLDPSARVSVGEKVHAIGNAGGTGSLKSAYGSITGTGRAITASDSEGGTSERLAGLIETNAGVIAGDSGGPLLNASGHVIGVVTAASTTGAFGFTRTPASDAFAIPIGKALNIAKAITAGRSSATVHVGPTAFLGVQVAAPDAGSVTSSGAVIVETVNGGPADSAGLAPGDVITGIDGRTVTSPPAVTAYILTKKPGAKVSVRYVDSAGTHTVTVTLGSGPPH